ncbi:MAG: lipid-A-disaccharide synthase [Candidatus Eisenbacteria bacterium]|uniref:Lipid-A-disaccharide synthase n=1 Tax=Eiseniibacteriota bacterium TaxID=2212470 RepID=A0A948W650_UNCEI|nr:lipid-A-disaccharide synthase [Candidatus Eisenbacteria bacterium]MBU1949234.1 lipid-A-disaccharide synthase [Candidatus Eisenbacteria bacterium]MBU2690266.1 lipid-A-disaccharide synthase [Candidatus Eisenbacteria bacterium]
MLGPHQTIFLAAGERSGDLHGAGLAAALRRQNPALKICGIGGPEMAAAGVELWADYGPLAVVGFTEVLPRIPRILSLINQLGRRLEQEKPDLYVAIDAPDFNFRLMKRARSAKIPIVYYIVPQFWAWRRGRLKTLARSVRSALVLFPFEKPLLEEAGVPAHFVGHPGVETLLPAQDKKSQKVKLGFEGDKPLIALLPGSRISEWRRHAKPLIDAMRWTGSIKPDFQWGLSIAPGLSPPLSELGISADLDTCNKGKLMIFRGSVVSLLQAADATLVASGTASLEAAFLETPMIVFYRVSSLTYLIARWFIRIKHFAMVNVLAGESLVPELAQSKVAGASIGRALLDLLDNPESLDRQLRGFRRIREQLARPVSYDRTADYINRILEGQVDDSPPQ